MNIRRNMKIDFKEKTIIITKKFSKQAQIFGTTENTILFDVLKNFRDYEVKIKVRNFLESVQIITHTA